MTQNASPILRLMKRLEKSNVLFSTLLIFQDRLGSVMLDVFRYKGPSKCFVFISGVRCVYLFCLELLLQILYDTQEVQLKLSERWLNLIWWGWKYFVAREDPLPPPCNSFIAGNLHRFGAIQLSFFSQQASPPHIWPEISKMELSCQLWIFLGRDQKEETLFFKLAATALLDWSNSIFPFHFNKIQW